MIFDLRNSLLITSFPIHIFLGPLVYIDPSESSENTKIATLIGIVAWNAGCGDVNYPDVYSKVSDVLDWITRETGFRISFLRTLFTNKWKSLFSRLIKIIK